MIRGIIKWERKEPGENLRTRELIFIPVLIFSLFGCRPLAAEDRACVKNVCYEIEVVSKSEELQRGLQFRESMPKNHGMLFVFQGMYPYPFWMKDTKIPLDMIWMDDSRRVVYIASAVPPCLKDPCPTYTPTEPALYVLELNAGEAKRIGLEKENQVIFDLKE